jgi:16S rRNA (cytidine1402-2'-O)-methyltransferase
VFVFYESPHRIIETTVILRDIDNTLTLVVCNDLTKKFERIYRGNPEDVLGMLRDNPNISKGEYTVIVKSKEALNSQLLTLNSQLLIPNSQLSIESLLTDICIKDKITLKDAISRLFEQEGNTLSKKEIYNASLNLKNHFANFI